MKNTLTFFEKGLDFLTRSVVDFSLEAAMFIKRAGALSFLNIETFSRYEFKMKRLA
jgi:hypothetical protein